MVMVSLVAVPGPLLAGTIITLICDTLISFVTFFFFHPLISCTKEKIEKSQKIVATRPESHIARPIGMTPRGWCVVVQTQRL